jgi:Kef-type K+ transport system membrane component KefB
LQDFFFLPSWPLPLGELFWLGTLLLLAGVTGEAVERWLKQPPLLGWVLVGLVLGPHVTGGIGASDLQAMNGLVQFASGIVLFELGQRVDFSWLKRNPKLLGTSLLESGLAFAVVFFIIEGSGGPLAFAAVVAGISAATSPAVVLTVIRDLRGQGQVTERLLLLTALNSTYSFIAVNMLLAPLATEYKGDWVSVVTYSAYLVLGSLAFAALFAAATNRLLRALGRREDVQFVCIVALLIVAVWATMALELSTPLTLLGYGTMLRTFDTGRHFVSLKFGKLGRLAVILLFSATAAFIDPAVIPAGIGLGIAVIVGRFAGKTLGVFAYAKPSGLTYRKAWFLSLGLIPKSGVAIILVNETILLYPAFAPELIGVFMSVVLLLELAGPSLLQMAIIRSGEAAEKGPA